MIESQIIILTKDKYRALVMFYTSFVGLEASLNEIPDLIDVETYPDTLPRNKIDRTYYLDGKGSPDWPERQLITYRDFAEIKVRNKGLVF